MPSRFAPVCLLAAVLVSTSACAHTYYGYDHAARYQDEMGRRAYAQGYRDGLRHGNWDARDDRRFDFRRHDDYRDADGGYRHAYGDRDDYRRAYRGGFAAGYADGYDRIARGPYESRYPAPPVAPYPPQAGDGPYAAYRSPAADVGYRDGYDVGRSDARHGEGYDPVRSKRYRSGDHGYKGDFGPRDEYKREYRAAFQDGYERGYRESGG